MWHASKMIKHMHQVIACIDKHLGNNDRFLSYVSLDLKHTAARFIYKSYQGQFIDKACICDVIYAFSLARDEEIPIDAFKYYIHPTWKPCKKVINDVMCIAHSPINKCIKSSIFNKMATQIYTKQLNATPSATVGNGVAQRASGAVLYVFADLVRDNPALADTLDKAFATVCAKYDAELTCRQSREGQENKYASMVMDRC